MSRRMMTIALAGLAACGGPPRSENAPPPAAEGGPVVQMTVVGGTPVIYPLLGLRERLGLSGAQVTALDSIATAWSATHQALARELRDAANPAVTLQHIAQNNLAAHLAVEAVLTPEQRRTVCQIEAEQRTARGEPAPRVQPRAPRGRGGRGPRGRAEPPPVPAATGWAWCSRAPAAQPAP